MAADRWGYQWIVDPAGHRWRIEGFGPITAALRDEDGREIGVGRSILRLGFASGAWKMAEFEDSALPSQTPDKES